LFKDLQAELSDRLLRFATAVLKLGGRLGRTRAGWYVCGQLVRSSTSSGANYEEACGGESHADFVHKLQIVLKELRESGYWLRLIRSAEMIPPDEVDPILKEADELCRIIGKSVSTAKSNRLSGSRDES
jgi:four helix bundle protein